MDIITNLSTQEIISQNKYQRFVLDKFVLKQDVDKKLTINAITCSILNFPFTSDDDEMENGVNKSIVLEPTIKNLMKETRLCHRAAGILVMSAQNVRS